MAQYRFKIGTFKASPKQYLVIDEEVVALHLNDGTEKITVPGDKDNPPREVIARAVTQADLEFLYNNPKGRHPFVEPVPEKTVRRPVIQEPQTPQKAEPAPKGG